MESDGKPFPKTGVIALLTVIVAAAGVVATVMVPEIRDVFGLRDLFGLKVAPVKVVRTIDGRPPLKPEPVPPKPTTKNRTRPAVPPEDTLSDRSITQSAPPPEKPIKRGIFETDSYILRSETLRKVGYDIHLTVTAETQNSAPMRFYISNCYLLDNTGERSEMDGFDPDTGHFVQAVAELIPGTRLKSIFHFKAKSSNEGNDYTFVCTEQEPQAQRKIVLSGIRPT